MLTMRFGVDAPTVTQGVQGEPDEVAWAVPPEVPRDPAHAAELLGRPWERRSGLPNVAAREWVAYLDATPGQLRKLIPILWSGLLTPEKGEVTYVFPEHRLRHGTQYRLADFLLSLALTRRDVVVYTDSEILFGRLWLRTCMIPPEERGFVRVLFGDRQEQVDLASDRPEMWPKDFCNEGLDHALQLLAVRDATLRFDNARTPGKPPQP